jgi:hypothetical protein
MDHKIHHSIVNYDEVVFFDDELVQMDSFAGIGSYWHNIRDPVLSVE